MDFCSCPPAHLVDFSYLDVEGWHYVSMPSSADEQGFCERLVGRVCEKSVSRCQCHLAQMSNELVGGWRGGYVGLGSAVDGLEDFGPSTALRISAATQV